MSDDAVPHATADHTADHTDDHTDDHEALAVAWALHALDSEEEDDVAAHLATCARCRRTVDETLETFGGIAEALEPATPPPALRARLLDAAADDPPSGEVPSGQVPSGEVPPTVWASSSRRAASDDREAPAPATRGGPPRHASVVPLRRRRATRWLAVAAAAVVLAAVGGLAVATQSLRSERDAAAAQAQRDAAIVDVLSDAGTPGVVHATLVDPQGALVGLVVADASGPRVLTTGLSANEADQIYVLWGLAGASPRPLGTFDVAAQAPAVHSVPSGPEAAPYAGFAVSLEPGRTAPASPTRVVASGQVGR